MAEQQGSLFGVKQNQDGEMSFQTSPEKITRPVHGGTSLEAAANLIASGSFSERCKFALALVKKYPGRTGAELDRIAKVKKREISKRLADVQRHGDIKSPDSKVRTCSVLGTKCKTWWPVEESK